MDKSNSNSISQKVRWHLTSRFGTQAPFCFVFGVALFYAWNLFAIYSGPVISSGQVDSIPYLSTIVTSTAATLGFLAIALVFYRLSHFNRIGLVAALIAGISSFAGLLVTQSDAVNPELAQLVVDGICRVCSCWVIVAWVALAYFR
jgi:hypothetical protein